MSTHTQDRESCECGWLQRAATDPEHPVKFDHRLNEFNIVKGERRIRIYHCPFCGGKTPESLAATFFAHVSTDEQERLLQLVAALEFAAHIFTKLGQPDRDDPVGAVTGMPVPVGHQVTQFSSFRVLTYSKLSPVADLLVHLHPDGRVATFRVMAKYIGNVP